MTRTAPPLLPLLIGCLLLPHATSSAQQSGGPAPVASSDAPSIRFQRQLAAPGERSSQQFQCELDLTMSLRQAGQTIQSQTQQVTRRQDRQLTILKVGEAAPSHGEVTYTKSEVAVEGEQVNNQTAQPVTGKTYRIHRDDDGLHVSYPDGSQPSAEELAIVKQNMASFGLPNPIARFFHGRTVRVGQVLDLPAELARDLVGFTTTGNTASQFRLKLLEIRRPPNDTPLARFAIQLRASDPDDSGVTMNLDGHMLIEASTCRSRAVNLQGPVAATETRGPAEASFEVHSEGKMQVAVRSTAQRR